MSSDWAHHCLVSLALPALQEQFRPLALAVVLDSSYSMLQHLPKLRAALEALLRACKPEHVVSLISFSDEAKLLLKAAPNSTVQAKAGMRASRELNASGGTRMSKGIDLALRQLQSYADLDRRILFFTDGRNSEDSSQLQRVARACREQGVQVTAWGLGQDWEPEELLLLARSTGGEANCVFDAGELVKAFLGVLRSSQRIEGIRLAYEPLRAGCRLKLATQVCPSLFSLNPESELELGFLESDRPTTFHLESGTGPLSPHSEPLLRLHVSYGWEGGRRCLPPAELAVAFVEGARPHPYVTHFMQQKRAFELTDAARAAIEKGNHASALPWLNEASQLSEQTGNLSMKAMIDDLKTASRGQAATQALKTVALRARRTVLP